jgi:hypothetical protein
VKTKTERGKSQTPNKKQPRQDDVSEATKLKVEKLAKLKALKAKKQELENSMGKSNTRAGKQWVPE